MWQQARRSGAPRAAVPRLPVWTLTDHACLTDILHPADKPLLRLRGPQRPSGRAVRPPREPGPAAAPLPSGGRDGRGSSLAELSPQATASLV